MRIGELARRTGVPTKTIRYYEDIDLLPAPARSSNGYRDYDEEAVELLSFIRDAQATGLSLAEITSIVHHKQAGDATCHHVLAVLEEHLRDVDAQIKNLRKTRKRLAGILERARALDPSQCTDPIRCQTIEEARDRHGRNRLRLAHTHGAS